MVVRKINEHSHDQSTENLVAEPDTTENCNFEGDHRHIVSDNTSSENLEESENLFDENAIETVLTVLLELREKFFVTTETTCFLSEKLSSILKIDRKRHAKSIKASLMRNNHGFIIDHETDRILECTCLLKI